MSANGTNNNLRIAICGGGIGGLALAVTLSKHSDRRVDVYEAMSEISTVGAGITAWKRTWRVMQLLGLDEELAKKAISPPEESERPGFSFRRSDQHEEGYNFYQMIVPYGAIALHRADLLDVLKRSLGPNCTIHLSKRLVSYEDPSGNGPMSLHFSDGTAAPADILVGGDGIHSTVRPILLESIADHYEHLGDSKMCDRLRQAEDPIWTGTLIYRSLVPTDEFRAHHPDHQAAYRPMIYVGKSKHVVSYPISQGKFINLGVFVSEPEAEGAIFEGKWVVDVPQEEIREPYKDFELEVRQIIEHMKQPSRWATHVMRPLPHYAFGRVVLLGDSAHALAPHLAAGAGQAIEDAYILGRLLSHDLTTRETLPAALQVYEDIRMPFANLVVQKSRQTGLVYELNHKTADRYENAPQEKREKLDFELASEIYDEWEWQWVLEFDEDWEKAERSLRDLLEGKQDGHED